MIKTTKKKTKITIATTTMQSTKQILIAMKMREFGECLGAAHTYMHIYVQYVHKTLTTTKCCSNSLPAGAWCLELGDFCVGMRTNRLRLHGAHEQTTTELSACVSTTAYATKSTAVTIVAPKSLCARVRRAKCKHKNSVGFAWNDGYVGSKTS